MAGRVRGVTSVVGARARDARENAVTVAARVDVCFQTQTTFLFVYIRTRLLNVTRIGQAGHGRIGAGAGQPAWRFRTRTGKITTGRMMDTGRRSKGQLDTGRMMDTGRRSKGLDTGRMMDTGRRSKGLDTGRMMDTGRMPISPDNRPLDKQGRHPGLHPASPDDPTTRDQGANPQRTN